MIKLSMKEEQLFNVLNDWLDIDQATFHTMIEDIRASGALDPEPSTDDERKALAVIVAYTEDDYLREHGTLGGSATAVADAIISSPVWRNRGSGPITREMVEELASEHYRRSAVYNVRMPWEELPLAYRLNRLYEMRNTLRAVGMIQ